MDASRRHGDLTAGEARVLGCLIEKEATTPDAYPLTVNSLRNACNQATSRFPVMAMTDVDVGAALASLRERGLTRTVHSTSNRAAKYRHVAPDALGLAADETAVLAVLLLRGEQTIGELKSRTERQHAFGSADEVAAVLHALASLTDPLVRQLERQPGQKDARWLHLLGEQLPHESIVTGSTIAGSTTAGPGTTEQGPIEQGPIDVGDPYGEATAEFYDLLATSHWEDFGVQLLDLLADVEPGDGPIIDLGSGTGVGLAAIAVAVPGAHILAIEPSKAMRTALHTRLMIDAGLRAITTVDPRPWGSAHLPERASALVASALLGHLDQEERDRLWRFVAERMPVGAPAVVELLPPARPISVPLTRFRSVDVGEYTYEGWQAGEPIDDRHMSWTLQYAVRHGDQLIASYEVTCRWQCFGVDDIRAEIAPYGLSLTQRDDAVVVRRTN